MRTACTGSVVTRPALLAWLRGSRPINSTSTAPGRWRAAGCAARIAYWTRSRLDPTTAGSPFTRDTSPMRTATPLQPGSLRPLPRSSGGGSASRTSRCSGSLSRERRSWRAQKSTRGCAVSTRRQRPRWRAKRRSRSPAPGRVACSSPRVQPCSTTTGLSRGLIASPSSPSAMAAATCLGSAEPSTAQCTSGAASGRKRRPSWSPRSTTSPAHARLGRRARYSSLPS